VSFLGLGIQPPARARATGAARAASTGSTRTGS